MNLTYREFISEVCEDLKDIFMSKGKYLVVGGTGGGKTYATMEIFKTLSRIYTDRVFIIACPNRIQNLQNQQYGVTAVVGGKIVDRAFTTSSMVYDKAEDILNNFHLYKDYKITLVVDEAHQLIYSKNFRRKAIQSILKLEEKCNTVIHMTATPRANKIIYDYDEVINLVPWKEINNVTNLGILKSKDGLTALYEAINLNIKKDKKILIFLNNKEKINEIKLHLQKLFKDKTIGTVDADDKKGNDIFNSIVEDSLIPSKYDIVLTTSVLECGTNINNLNYTPIMYIDSNLHFNLDSIAQQIARFRKKVDLALLVFKEPAPIENFRFKKLIDIVDSVSKEILEKNKHLNSICEMLGAEGHKIVTQLLSKEKSFDDIEYTKGLTFYDDDELIVKTDLEKLTSYALSLYDYQLLRNTDVLIKELKEVVKAKNISLINHCKAEIEAVKEIKEIIKEKQATKKEYKIDLKKRFSKMLDSDSNKLVFTDYILSEDDEKDIYKIAFNQESKELIQELETEKSILKDIKATIKNNEPLGIDTIIKYKFDEETLKGIRWVMYNQLGEDIKIIDTRYSIIRKKLDCKIQKRLSNKDIELLYKTLNPKKKDIKKVPPMQREKLLKDIKLIYNVTEGKDGNWLNSLIK